MRSLSDDEVCSSDKVFVVIVKIYLVMMGNKGYNFGEDYKRILVKQVVVDEDSNQGRSVFSYFRDQFKIFKRFFKQFFGLEYGEFLKQYSDFGGRVFRDIYYSFDNFEKNFLFFLDCYLDEEQDERRKVVERYNVEIFFYFQQSR